MRRLNRTTAAISIVLLCSSPWVIHDASAQVPPPLVGTWKASWSPDKRVFEARVVVTETGGTWQTSTQDKTNPCVGRAVPMKIESSSPTEVRFVLQFSEVIAGCSNTTVVLKAEADGSIKGIRSDRFELTLVKQN